MFGGIGAIGVGGVSGGVLFEAARDNPIEESRKFGNKPTILPPAAERILQQCVMAVLQLSP